MDYTTDISNWADIVVALGYDIFIENIDILLLYETAPEGGAVNQEA